MPHFGSGSSGRRMCNSKYSCLVHVLRCHGTYSLVRVGSFMVQFIVSWAIRGLRRFRDDCRKRGLQNPVSKLLSNKVHGIVVQESNQQVVVNRFGVDFTVGC